jgi:hypothetical protein
MDQRQILQEFSALPPEAQKLVAELIVLLGKRNQRPRPVQKIKPIPIIKEKFIGIWQNREDMQDSHAYVRNLRQHEWA